jgi:tRNAThr (cytosine32-N3)-methyltransferase
MKHNQNPRLRLHACDFSKKAIDVIKSSSEFNSPDMIGQLEASVWDISSPKDDNSGKPQLPEGVAPESVDVVVLIFIFSALSPTQWQQAIENVWHLLKPGGIVLFRDYGRGDLAQVRFRKGRWLEENFYVRGDGTRVYFFDEIELKELWTGGGGVENQMQSMNLNNGKARAQFEVMNFGVDRRMLVNRQRKLKMYRCWLQARFKKPQISSN